jgi:hypothetical protein
MEFVSVERKQTAKNLGGRPSHQPTGAMRKQVETLAAYGIPEWDISRVVGIDPKTLRKYYADELDLGETKANAQVAGFLFAACRAGNVGAQIFWLKTRARWREYRDENVIVAGKKEQTAAAAATAGQGTEWGDDLTFDDAARLN